MAYLEIHYAGGRTDRVDLHGAEAVIGRDAGCEVSLEDTITSRHHARVYTDGAGQYWIQDLNSKNGVLINDSQIVVSRIRNGDWISIGACRLLFALDSEERVVMDEPAPDTTFASKSAWGGDQQLELTEKRLAKLYELNERLTSIFDRDDLLNEVLDICAEHLRFERAGIAVRRGDSSEPLWIELRDVQAGAAAEFRISRSIVDRALNHGERVLVVDTADTQIDPTESMISNNIRSVMCVPMEYHQKVQGVVYGDRVTSTGGYTKGDLDFFAALGRLGAMGLANAALVDEIRERQQVETQVRLGREIQAGLFPAKPLTQDRLTIDALNDPGQKISGDYYDFFRREDDKIVVIIADVAGKGIPASLLTANLQAGARVLLATSEDLVEAVVRLNKLICENVADSRFITGIFGLLDPASRRFTYVNAGHLGPYLLRTGGKVEKVHIEPSLPLGIEESYAYESGTIDVGPSPVTLLLYTDGVPDAENDQRQQYLEDRFTTALEGVTDLPPGEMLDRLRRSIKQFTRMHPQTDDITMVAVQME